MNQSHIILTDSGGVQEEAPSLGKPVLQSLLTEIAKLINPFLLHFPLTVDEELPTFAFPYSPVHSDRGCVYEFALHHVLELNDPMDAFQIKTLEV